MQQLSLEEIRAIPTTEPWGELCYSKELREGRLVFPQLRQQPCGDCAVTTGLYSEIAAGCYQQLDEAQRQTVASGWFCHNGGRCEGVEATFTTVGPISRMENLRAPR